MEVMGWLIAVVVFTVIELMTVGLTTIWLAGGALIAFLAAMLGLPLAVQAGLFVGVSVLLMLFTRPLALKYLNSRTEKTNVDSLAGQTAVVMENIDNIKGTGKVLLNGMDWTARSVDGIVIPVETEVVVKEVQGVKLMVAEKQ